MYHFNINGCSFYNGFATMKLMVCGKSLSVPEEHTKTLDSRKMFHFLTGDCYLAQVLPVFQAEGM